MPHARHDVPHRHVQRGLPLVLVANPLVGGGVLVGEPLVEPAQRGENDLRVLVAQALDQLDTEGARNRPPLVRAKNVLCVHGLGPACGEEAIGDLVRCEAGELARHHPVGRPAQILDQHDAQRDRHRPELADRQRGDPLVGAQERAEEMRLEAAVGVRDDGPGHAVHARIAGERPVHQLRQLAVVAARQIVADLADLLLDDVHVVDEPFRRGRGHALVADAGRDRAVGAEQHAFVLAQTRGERTSARAACVRHALGGGQALGVLLQALDAEELRADQLLRLAQKSVARGSVTQAHRSPSSELVPMRGQDPRQLSVAQRPRGRGFCSGCAPDCRKEVRTALERLRRARIGWRGPCCYSLG